MSTDTFIQINQSRIQNMDGNLDTASITILTPEGKLAFYHFEDGIMVNSQTQLLGKWWAGGCQYWLVPKVVMVIVARWINGLMSWWLGGKVARCQVVGWWLNTLGWFGCLVGGIKYKGGRSVAVPPYIYGAYMVIWPHARRCQYGVVWWGPVLRPTYRSNTIFTHRYCI